MWPQSFTTNLLVLEHTEHSSPSFWPQLRTKIQQLFSNPICSLLPLLACPSHLLVFIILLSPVPARLYQSPMLSSLPPTYLPVLWLLLANAVHCLANSLVSLSRLLPSTALILPTSSIPYSNIVAINHCILVYYL